MDRVQFGLIEIEVIRNVTFWNYQSMHRCDRKPISDRVAKLVLCDDAAGIDFAKQAPIFSEGVGVYDASKIGIVPVSLVRITCDAQRLEIAQLIAAAFGAWHDMINMQGSLVFKSAAKLTAVFGAL